MADDPSSPPVSHGRPFLALAQLLRAVGIASDARKLILAVVGLLATSLVWGYLSPSGAGAGPLSFWDEPGLGGTDLAGIASGLAARIAEPALILVSPFVALYRRGVAPLDWFRTVLMAVWGVVVWGLVGGAIARIAVVRAACGRRVGLGSAVRFALRKAGSLIGAPLIPFLPVSMFLLCCAGFGLLYRIPGGYGEAVAAVLWFLPLMMGLVATLILAGLALGWPLMHATVAAEDEDAADALSRSYSYVNQRLPRYLAHAAVAWGIGILGLALVMILARMVVGVSEWGVSLGAPGTTSPGRLIPAGWLSLIGLFVRGWAYSFFWTSASIIYLVLRRDVDGTEWEDVALPEHAADAFVQPAEVAAKAVEAEA